MTDPNADTIPMSIKPDDDPTAAVIHEEEADSGQEETTREEIALAIGAMLQKSQAAGQPFLPLKDLAEQFGPEPQALMALLRACILTDASGDRYRIGTTKVNGPLSAYLKPY